MCLYDHIIEVLPVGWGSLILHSIKFDHCCRRTINIVTDGGSTIGCFSHSLKSLLRNGVVERLDRDPWIWILSHLDYDHFSIVLKLIEERLLHKPEAVILPASYSKEPCQEALVRFLTLAKVTAFMLNFSPPKYEKILDFLARSGVKTYGFSAGIRFITYGLRYRFIWPELNYVVSACKELVEILDEKILRICRGNEECIRKARKLMDELSPRIKDIGKKVADVGDIVDLKDLVSEVSEEEGLRYESQEVLKLFNGFKQEDNLSADELFSLAQRRLKDRFLYLAAKRTLNSFSLAYMISKLYIDLNPLIVKVFDHKKGILCLKKLSKNYGSILLYPDDLVSDELDEALRYAYNNFYIGQLPILIALHHGNAYSNYIGRMRPEVIYMSRCDTYNPKRYRYPFRRNLSKYLNKADLITIIRSNHGIGLRIVILI